MKSDSRGRSGRFSAARTAFAKLRSSGFGTVLIPTLNKPKQAIDGIDVVPVERVADALEFLRRAG